MKLQPHMLYCYNSNPNDTTSMLNYLYMLDSKNAFLFPQFFICNARGKIVKKVLDSRTCNFCADNLRPVSNHPCLVKPCLIYQNGKCVCLGLTSPTQVIALRPELIDIMQDVDVKILPLFVRGKRFTNKYSEKQYLFKTIDGISLDAFLFIDVKTGDYAYFESHNMEGFVIEGREDA